MKRLLSFILLLLMLVLPVLGMTSCLLLAVPGGGSGGDGGEDIPPDPEEEYSFWRKGFIGSDKNAAYPEKLKDGDDEYIYSDVIELGAAGTSVTFTEPQGVDDNLKVYILSFWKQVGGEWVLDTDAPNQREDSSLIRSAEGNRTTYT